MGYQISTRAILLSSIITLLVVGLGVLAYYSIMSLMLASNVRSTVVQINGYHMAVYQFQSKYNDLPGDIKRATSFGLTSNNIIDGNGNTRLDDGSNALVMRYFSTEHQGFWGHLINAGMIDDALDFSHLLVGYAYPRIPLGNGGIIAYSEGSQHYWLVGVSDVISNKTLDGIIGNQLTPQQALAIDEKIDDGKANFGKIMTALAITESAIQLPKGGTLLPTTCISDTFTYNLENKKPSCTLRIRLEPKF